MSGAIPVQRGCGTRNEGAIYAEVGVSEHGLPLEDFLIDPPVILDSALGVSPIGVTLITANDNGQIVYHVADWIGANNYPNIWDFLGEARNFGISRRLPKSLDFSKLSAKSRLLCIHSRAVVLNSVQYSGNSRERFGEWAGDDFTLAPKDLPKGVTWEKDGFLYGGWICPKGLASHEPQHFPVPCCAGVWGQDITDSTPLTDAEREAYSFQGQVTTVDGAIYPATDPRLVLRVMPSFRYVARRAPEGIRPEYAAGFFASFPLSRLVVIQGEGDAEALDKANAAKLSVNLVQE